MDGGGPMCPELVQCSSNYLCDCVKRHCVKSARQRTCREWGDTCVRIGSRSAATGAMNTKGGRIHRYSYNDAESVNRIDVIDVSCEEHAQEVLGFSNSFTSGNPTSSLDPILSTSFPSLTPFEGGDFILEEIKACLTNDSIPPGIDDADFNPEGDLLLLEKLLNDDPW
ncbi:hypothetical protein Tco_0108855 [Tanacetum coccineum]